MSPWNVFASALLGLATASLHSAPTRDEVVATMKKAAAAFEEKASFRGGYVYYVTLGGRRLGEGEAAATEIWVQPPGTPAVGEAFLKAHEATGEASFLEAATKAGEALAYGQLESGGWRNSIDFDPAGPRVDQYRNGKGRGKNFSTLDDDITQSALKFLIRLDRALGGGNPDIRGAVGYALPRLLAAQYANGGFPQGWTGPVPARPVVKASFPSYDWRTEGRIKEYWNEYTLNDGMALSMTDLLLTAWKIGGHEPAREALSRFGGFLLLAQLPDPQPAWAQQYGPDMHPIWARAFEPPAVSGRESEDAMIALLRISELTGEDKYAAPVVPAVKYLESSLLPDGQLARYYEIGTNRPLYMQRNGKAYELTNDDSNLPDHYGWKNPSRLGQIKDAWRALAAKRPLSEVLDPGAADAATVMRLMGELDPPGLWITTHDGSDTRLVGQPKFAEGEAYLDSGRFATGLGALASYVRGLSK
jgi:PelA/Pel-15E family pectate lyase